MHCRFYAPNLFSGCHLVELPADEAEHLSRVLRLRVGAEVRLFDGRGHEFDGRVEVVERARVVVAAGRELPDAGAEPKVSVVLAQALLKGDAMDQVVRDAVMLGVAEIIPLETARCEMPAKRVKSTGRVARWQRIAVASVKQCGRAVVPKVQEPRRLDECLRGFQGTPSYMLAEPAVAAFIPASVPPSPPLAPASALLVVGPEGGWTTDEVAAAVAAGCRPLTLGPRTIRADAAAIVGLTALQCFWGEFNSGAGGR